MDIKKDNILTNREVEIAVKLIGGASKTKIAKALNISTSTVKSHVEHIYLKLGIHNKIELAIKLLKII